jgi:hypothetical protein
VPLLHLFVADSDPHHGISPSTFAWPIPGGWRRWREEVVGRLAAIGRPPDHALVDGLAPYEAVARGRPVD